jgi:hypothetical protein
LSFRQPFRIAERGIFPDGLGGYSGPGLGGLFPCRHGGPFRAPGIRLHGSGIQSRDFRAGFRGAGNGLVGDFPQGFPGGSGGIGQIYGSREGGCFRSCRESFGTDDAERDLGGEARKEFRLLFGGKLSEGDSFFFPVFHGSEEDGSVSVNRFGRRDRDGFPGHLHHVADRLELFSRVLREGIASFVDELGGSHPDEFSRPFECGFRAFPGRSRSLLHSFPHSGKHGSGFGIGTERCGHSFRILVRCHDRPVQFLLGRRFGLFRAAEDFLGHAATGN